MLITPTRSRDATALQRRIRSRQARVGIVGIGYAGLPLALACVKAGYQTLGLDVDEARVRQINGGTSPVSSIENSEVHPAVSAGLLRATADFRSIETLDCLVVCVPTPLTAGNLPDTRYVEAAMRAIADHLAPQSLVVLQSSSYPGSTRELALPALEARGWRVGCDVYLAYAPERIDPGNRRFGVRNTPKLVGGITSTCTKVACSLFEQFVETVVPVRSPEVAEMAKLVENTFRFINISFVNEVAILCDRLGLSAWEVIGAASTKPFAFLPHYPGPGVGGDCIPVMPLYLEWCANREDLSLKTVAAARAVNRRMPEFVVEKLARLLRDRKTTSLDGARVLVAGVSYKPDLADLRNAPSLQILSLLNDHGVNTSYHDPLVPTLLVGDAELTSTGLETVADYDAVVLVTPHRSIDYDRLIAGSRLILDTQNALASRKAPNVVHL
jgi:UDP-N-acetyl-D-glucosamine dehydrogenase